MVSGLTVIEPAIVEAEAALEVLVGVVEDDERLVRDGRQGGREFGRTARAGARCVTSALTS